MSSSAAASSTSPRPVQTPLSVTDVQAVNEIVRGNREMFEVLVRRYNGQLYRVGMAYLRNHAQTEDAMQNAYLKAFLNMSRFRRSSGFGTWLTRIMINECLMMLRSKKRVVLENIDETDARANHEAVFAPATDPVRNAEIRAAVEEALESLPRVQRTVYVLRDIQHLSTAEAADCLGLSRENVKVMLHRARERLKAKLMETAAGVELYHYSATCCDPMTAKVMDAVLAS